MRSIDVLMRLFKYCNNYKLKIFLLIFIGSISVAFEVLKPLPVKLVLDNIMADKPLPGIVTHFFPHLFFKDKHNLLISCVSSLLIFTLLGSLLTLLASQLTVKLSQKLVYDLSLDFYSKLQQLSLSFYNKNKAGDLLQRMNGDVFVIYFLVAQIIIPAITSVICLGAMFYIMARIDYTLAIIAFAVVPALGVMLALFAKPMNDTTMKQYSSQGQLSSFVQQSLSAMKMIQAFGREAFMFNKLKIHAQNFGDAFQLATKVSTTYNQLTLLITGLASAALIGLGAYKGLNGVLSAGDLYIFIGYIAGLYGPVNSLSTAIGTSIALGARGKRIFEILDSEEVVKEKRNAVKLLASEKSIEFRNVSFGYPSEKKSFLTILHDISFKVHHGEIVALVGETGAGKTSIISLLTRFYEPLEGSILIDDIDVADLQLQSLRGQVSLVLQDPFLFSMSVADNIAFGNPAASFEEITEAAKAAQAHEFILKMPLGYDTIISENGASLSGGERQRIAIARAFLKKASILILDEPTSAVDALTEAKIFEALSHYSKGKTVFLISHRLSTLKHADQIITIKGGRVVEQGTHHSLLEKGKEYAGLYKYQHIT